MDEHTKIAITRLGNRMRAAGTAELGATDLDTPPDRFEALLDTLRDLFPDAVDESRAVLLGRHAPDDARRSADARRDADRRTSSSTSGHGSQGWSMACGSGARRRAARVGRGSGPGRRRADAAAERYRVARRGRLSPPWPPCRRCTRPTAMRALEAARVRSRRPARLMARAGLAAAEFARELLGDSGRAVLVLAGPGNNGGDAFEVGDAPQARASTASTSCSPATTPRSCRATPAQRATRSGTPSTAGCCSRSPSGARYDLVVDGLFGIGLARAARRPHRRARRGRQRPALPQARARHRRAASTATPARCWARCSGPPTRITFIAGKPGLLHAATGRTAAATCASRRSASRRSRCTSRAGGS